MDRKDKEPRGSSATASKTAANRKQSGGESPSPDQGSNTSQNQGGTQNQSASGSSQQNQGGAGASQQTQGQPQNQATQNETTRNQATQNSGGAQDLLQQAKQTTNEVVNQVQQQATSQLNQQKETAASELSTVVNAVRRFGESLNNEGQGPITRMAAQYGDKAAEGLDRVARYLREQDPKRLLNDVQNFGRRQPALLIGGAFLLGFAGARIIKSSMDAANGSTNTGTESEMNSGRGSSAYRGSQQQQQPHNTNVMGAQPSTAPPPNPAI